jgi:flagellar export protein FliJ
MPFHFPLQAVFHYRQSVEHQQELRLRVANQQVARVRHVLEQLELRRMQMRAHQSQHLKEGMTSAELRFGLLAEVALNEQQEQVATELHRVQNLREQQHRIFQHARREREVFESLRDRQIQQYQLQASRREQREQDDLFLLRRAYLQRSWNLPRRRQALPIADTPSFHFLIG